MSKFKSLFFACCFLISSFSFAEVLCGEAYQETLCKHIADAKDSIVVAMGKKGTFLFLKN